MVTSPIAPRLAGFLRTLPGHLYGVVDAAIDDGVLCTITAFPNSLAQTLFDDTRAIEYAHVGPYFVDLGEGHDELLHSILERAWGNSWGLFLTSGDDFNETREHLSNYLTAELPSEERVYFRFFDPRVMSILAPTLDAKQALICTRAMAFEIDGGRACLVIERGSSAETESTENLGNGLVYRKVMI